MFRVYDYTDATRLFGQGFVTRPVTGRASRPGETPPTPSERTFQVEGFDVHVTAAGQYIVTSVDGQARLVTVEEYRALLARRLVEEVPSLVAFRKRWIVPPERRALLGRLPDAGRSALLVRALAEMTDFDLYDVLAELGYGLAPRTRPDRAEAFGYKHEAWLARLPQATAATLRALTTQFARAGTDGLESPEVFRLPEVVRAGGLAALKILGKPAEILRETKARLFAA
jgi:type I restriction enzyme R subunit